MARGAMGNWDTVPVSQPLLTPGKHADDKSSILSQRGPRVNILGAQSSDRYWCPTTSSSGSQCSHGARALHQLSPGQFG